MINQIGFIGFGEASGFIAQGLSKNSQIKMYAFDVNVDHPLLGKNIKNKAEKSNVILTNTLEELTNQSEILFNLTSAKFALPIAKEISPFLKTNHLYIDMNAASPMIMKKIEEIISQSALFADGAVMESIPKFLHEVPILISGENAQKVIKLTKNLGMNMKYVNSQAGSASAIKMIRSIFMKGFAMLLLETLEASNKYGVDSEILISLEQSIQNDSLIEISNRLVGRSAIHAERRIAEMNEVIATLDELGLDDIMSKATVDKLQYLLGKNLIEHFNNEAPDDYVDVIRAYRK